MRGQDHNQREMNNNVGAPQPGLETQVSCVPSVSHPQLTMTHSYMFAQYIMTVDHVIETV